MSTAATSALPAGEPPRAYSPRLLLGLILSAMILFVDG